MQNRRQNNTIKTAASNCTTNEIDEQLNDLYNYYKTSTKIWPSSIIKLIIMCIEIECVTF